MDINYLKFSILIIFVLIFSSPVYSQEKFDDSKIKNFYYKLKYQPDSLDQNKYEEIFQLSVNEGKSIFTDVFNKKADSMEVDIREYQQKYKPSVYSFKGVPKAKFTYYIIKDLINKSLDYYDKIGAKHFVYTESNDLQWELHPEVRIIENYHCQKASIKKYGRNFIAWFTKEVPINDGPYKFSGLPGLIIELYDTKGHYHFQLINYQKKNDGFSFEVPQFRIRKQITTDKESFVKGKRNYESSTVERLKGSFLSESLTEDRIKQIRERIKKNNNPLELKP